MEVALNSKDQEDGHCCFSDNTYREIVNNALSIKTSGWELCAAGWQHAAGPVAARSGGRPESGVGRQYDPAADSVCQCSQGHSGTA